MPAEAPASRMPIPLFPLNRPPDSETFFTVAFNPLALLLQISPPVM
jgi:hypothetical protein